MKEIQIMRNRRIPKLITGLRAMELQQVREKPHLCTTQQGAAEQLVVATAANLKGDRAPKTSTIHQSSKMLTRSPKIHKVQK